MLSTVTCRPVTRNARSPVCSPLRNVTVLKYGPCTVIVMGTAMTSREPLTPADVAGAVTLVPAAPGLASRDSPGAGVTPSIRTPAAAASASSERTKCGTSAVGGSFVASVPSSACACGSVANCALSWLVRICIASFD